MTPSRNGSKGIRLSASMPRRLTLSNGLTAVRLVSAPAFHHALVEESWTIACLLFWTAVASDWLDGRVARVRGESSAFGGLLDHASDAGFVVLGLFALAFAGHVPLLLPLLVVAAFLQYVLDSRALAGRRLRASALGRWNGILYFVPPGVLATREALGVGAPSDALILLVGWLLVLSTLASMADRAWALRAAEEPPPLER